MGLVYLILLAPMVLAQNFDFTSGSGWSWYVDPAQQRSIAPTPTPPASVEERMENLQTIIDRALYRSILDPSTDNIAHYITLQNQMGDHAHRYAEKWSTTLLRQPQLDYSLIQPTNSLARKTLATQAMLEQELAIELVAQTTGLLFFYRSDCPYCHRFAPLLKQFVTRYGIEIIAISLDGSILPDFPHPKFDTEQAQMLNISAVPAVFAANPANNTLVPIAFGFVTEDILLQRLVSQLLPEEARLVKQYFDQTTRTAL